MNQASEFQLKNPLSSKKFLKKMIGNFFPNLFTSLLFGIILGWGLVVLVTVKKPLWNLSENITTMVFLFIFLVGAIFVLRAIIYAIYIHLYIQRYYYDCSEQFVTIKKGVFSPVEIHVQYNKIQDVYVDQDILDRIMGLYDVHIASATATSGIEAHIDGVESDTAENIKNFMLDKIQNSSNSQNISASTTTPAQAVGETVQFNDSEKISSTNYPISDSWLFSSMVSTIFSNIFTVSAFYMIFFWRAVLSSTWWTHLLIWLGINAVFFVVSFIKLILWKNNYYFELLPDYILVKTGIISKRETHLPYRAVQDVSVYQPFIQRFFGLATLIIENAATTTVVTRRRSVLVSSKIVVPGLTLDKAQKLNEIFNKIVASKNSRNTGL